MLTILFDGIAYGMLLFVLACGLAVTLGLMNFVNLAHGAFAMAGGYVTVVLMNRSACRSSRRCRWRSSSRPLLGLVLERTLYVRLYAPQPSRPGAVLDRPRLHGGRGGRLYAWARSSSSSSCRPGCRAASTSSASSRPLPLLHHRRLRRARRRAAARPAPHALRQPAARGGRRSARGARARHQRQPDLRRHLRRRLRARRPRRRARRRDPRARSDLPAEVHDLLPDRRHGRRHHQHHRPVPRRAAARHRRRRGQVLRAAVRRLRHLRADDRRARPAPARACSRGRGEHEHLHLDRRRRQRRSLRRRRRWLRPRSCSGLARRGTLFLLPERHLILNEIAILGLFALSLDLILGYAGIVSLGHAAFFGLGAYTAGLLAKHVTGDPLLGLVAGAASRRQLSASSRAFSCCAAPISRG